MTSGIISPLDKLRIHWVKLDFIFDIKSLGKVKRGSKICINIMQSIAICSAHVFQGLHSPSTPEMLRVQRLIKHCWAGCLLSGLYMLVYSTHVTHHPWMKNSGMQSLWLHTNVATEGACLSGECATGWLIMKAGWKEVVAALSHNPISCYTEINSCIELSMFIYFSMLTFNFLFFPFLGASFLIMLSVLKVCTTLQS